MKYNYESNVACFHKVGEEGLTKLTLHVCEEGLRLTEEASHRLNRYGIASHRLSDLSNFSETCFILFAIICLIILYIFCYYRPISQWCLLLDLEGLNMRHLWRPGMKVR